MSTVIADRAAAVRPERGQGGVLRIVPIVGPSSGGSPYALFGPDTAGSVTVSEMSEGGSVPQLLVHNTRPTSVFLMDGQELVGAKQNRILNADVMVPAESTLSIPVSCVEAHRWNYKSRTFAAGKSASHRIRSAKLERVHDSLKSCGSHDADQRQVWAEVQDSLTMSKADSPTSSLSDSYAARQQELDDFRKGLSVPPDAVGVAVFHGSQWRGLDLFDRHATLAHHFASLVDGYALDWLGQPPAVEAAAAPAESAVIADALRRAAAGKWNTFRPPGEGEDYRLENDRLSGSALVWNDSVVHLQLFPKTAEAAPAAR